MPGRSRMFSKGPAFVVTVPAILSSARTGIGHSMGSLAGPLTLPSVSPWFVFVLGLIALVLGGLHALERGHGEPSVSMAGRQGTPGGITALRKAAGMLVLGLVTLSALRYFIPERPYRWLGVLTSTTILGIGALILFRRLGGAETGHDHGRNGFLPGTSDRIATGREGPLKQSLPGGWLAAMAVLLSALSVYRTAAGFFLIGAYCAGLAIGMIGLGIADARGGMTGVSVDGSSRTRWLPVSSGVLVMAMGLIVAWRSLAATSIQTHRTTAHGLGSLLFVIGLGLVLGMRHSTDADHVVAISTIVSRQRSIRGAAFIGSVWGIGHTITIFIVGSLIILFNVEIPARLGLSMEFGVAVMLVLLGVTNLTGVTQRMTQRFTDQDRLPDASNPVAADSLSFQEKVLQRTVGRYGVFQFVRPLVIGLVHGLAGSAAVALLVLSTIHDPLWATFYLLVFGAGTLVGMMCMTAAIAVPLKYVGGRSTKIGQYLNFASGMASLCFGSFLVYQLGFAGGLFSGHPQWTPR